MENVKDYVKGYIEGTVDADEFLAEYFNNTGILDWLQSFVPEGKTMRISRVTTEPKYEVVEEIVPFNCRCFFEEVKPRSNGKFLLIDKADVQSTLYRYYKEIFPDEKIKMDTSLNDKHKFLFEAGPECLDTPDIESAGIFDELFEQIPEGLNKKQRIKWYKTKLKEMFFIEGNKYPRWIQGSEWPLSKTGKPTKFIKQKSEDEIVWFFFLDVDTSEEIKVMQAY